MVAESEIVDRTAILGHENDIYLPYRHIKYFYGEYDHYCSFHNMHKDSVASLSTFRRAYTTLVRNMKKTQQKNLKLSGGKGTLYPLDAIIYNV